jgi:hypothetical protein
MHVIRTGSWNLEGVMLLLLLLLPLLLLLQRAKIKSNHNQASYIGDAPLII